jgi:Flp pilus assembly protein TadG
MNNSKRNQKGAVIILFTILMTVIISLMGLSLDGGYLYLQKARLQNTADAAALACVINSNICGAGGSNIFPIVNLYNFDVQTTKPVTCPLPSQTGCVKSVATTTWNTFFMGFIGQNQLTLSAVAIAGGTPQPQPCILALSGTGTGLSVTGNASMNAINCGVYVNSSSSQAMEVTGNASVTASPINTVGGYKKIGNATTSTVTTGATALTNPFTTIVTPPLSNPPSCDFTNFSRTDNGSVTMSPGTYCGGITIGKNYSVTFNPGLYVIYGRGMTFSGNTTLTGTGITIYNSGNGSSYPYAGLNLTSNSAINISAPTGGAYQGMLYMQDPANTQPSSIAGNSASTFNGNLYFPTSDLAITGNGGAALPVGTIVANKISITGNSGIKVVNTFITPTPDSVEHASLYQ